MPSFSPPYSLLLSLAVVLIFHSAKVAAFGAGNIASISAIEGQNWRHGDIEDTLLNIFMARAAGGKKFTKMDVKRVYFGNWLRDYSQAVDVGSVKYVSAEAVRLILWVLGFMSFGFGSGPFEVTRDRLGCYRPEEHIDNPKDYADNLDARQYDRRLRGPVDERRELSIDERTGLKHYIASEDQGINTSAGLVRDLYGRCIALGRQYARSHREADLHEALRLLGTANHCLEDYAAHSNYVELALIEMGERNVFPHVGRATQIKLPGARSGPVYPIITGTFGGVDFLHSVMGEFSDKASQSEIQQLQGTINSTQGQSNNFSLLQGLLSNIPDGIFGGQDQAGKASELQVNAQAAQMANTHISPREPEAWARQIAEMSKEIYPIIEWHDEIMQSLNEMIEKIPILPQMIEQLTEQVNIFVFSLISPFVTPIINQVKNELATGSSEIINSSKDKQHIVFNNDRSSDPTHSMLSKDHFSNILNEPAGKTSSAVLSWVVPQIMACWDDERIDPNRTINRIVNGVFHHPALRDYGDDGAVDGRRSMFSIVEQWWSSKDEQEKNYMRDQLSRDGVEQGRNHKEGVQDTGHGCGKPLGMPNMKTASSSGTVGGIPMSNVLGEIQSAFSGQSQFDSGAGSGGGGGGGGGANIGKFVTEAAGGGLLGGLAGSIGGGLLGDIMGGSGSQTQSRQNEYYGDDGSRTQTYQRSGYGQQGGQPVYGEANYSQTDYQGGGQRQEYEERRVAGGYREEEYVEERTTTRYSQPSGGYQSEVREERETFGGGYGGSRGESYQEEGRREEYSGGYGGGGRGASYGGGVDGAPESRYEQRGYGSNETYEERREESSGGGGFLESAAGFLGGGDERREESGGGFFGRGEGREEEREGEREEERYEERRDYGDDY